ncbi:GDSL esterase/lipase At5g33370-like isoform X2 [Dendrobium catenatum]|uniref:GDSL esterase/lipase At5g33370-like isoform X2 n=1 Tax=Dendrobium catenatum TaxID=906689 RepID=UPI00109F8168|nr:GDSL esterase/lipase At5g33370-like isoform X2 [Dendrobium catenatum]
MESFMTLFISLLEILLALGSWTVPSEAKAFFVFGDSLVDNGNNNFLATTARADSPPYGIDYPTHRPTGRFSNGLNIPDIISEQIGAETTLPYLSPELRGERLLVGANFASAGIGILNDTGIQFFNIIRINKQLEYFQQYQRRLSSLIGPVQSQHLVNGALVLITLGGNDFVNNYYLVPYSARSREFSLPDYVQYLISEYKKILARLYELGARRVLVTGTGPLGCVPAELALRSRTGDCDPELERAGDLFNPQLVQLLADLNRQIGADVIYILCIIIKMHALYICFMIIWLNVDEVTNFAGFVTSKIACCGQGPYNGIGLCTVASNLCPNRDIYAFWDGFHPSEKANRIIVSQFMTGSVEYMNPMNLSTILAMDEKA